MPDLRDVFGAAAPWVAAACLVALCIFFAVGLLQRREITLWPPKLGPPPQAPAGGAAETTQPTVTAAEPPPDSLPALQYAASDELEIFEVDRAAEFYEETAEVYDVRNSDDLVATHLATISRIRQLSDFNPALRVADLGGGTGNPIALAFYSYDEVEWTYVDVCRAMEARFQRLLERHPLGRRVTTKRCDLRQMSRQLPAGAYDVVLLSLVLTSMPALPDFADIARLLAPGGQLIVTDIGPGYTLRKPIYEVRVGNRLLGLRTIPVDPLEVVRRATQAGLALTELTPLGDGDVYYSFISSFAAVPVEPGPEIGDEALAAG